MTDLIREHDECYPALVILTEPEPFEVDGIRYWPDAASMYVHCRPMIELSDDGRMCGQPQRWDDPPTQAELDHYVREGTLPYRPERFV